MRKVIPLVLLIFSASVSLIMSAIGINEIISVLPKFDETQNMQLELFSRLVFVLLGIISIVFLLERLNIFNEIDTMKSINRKTDDKMSNISDEVRYIKENTSLLTEIRDIKDNTSNIILKISPFFQRFENPNHQRFHELLWKYMFRGDGSLDDSETLSVGSKTSISLWRDSISEATNWEAISYAKNLWQTDEQEVSKAHQDVYIKLGGIIYRIFVFDTEEERNEFHHDATKQDILSGGDIRWILKKKLVDLVNRRLKMDLESVGLMDFAIVDINKYVLWFKLIPSTKELQRAILTIDTSMVIQARAIFEIAYQNSQRFPQSEAEPDQVLETKKNRLRILQKQQAMYGPKTDPGTIIEIEDLQREIGD